MTRTATEAEIARARSIAELAKRAALDVEAHADSVKHIAEQLIAELNRLIGDEEEDEEDDRTA